MTTSKESYTPFVTPTSRARARFLRGKTLALAFGIGAALVAGGLVFGSRAREETVAVEAGPIERRILARAAVTPIDGVSEVRAEIDGRVLEVYVREGDRVAAGQRLAELEASTLDLAVARADAEVGVLEAELESLKRGGRREVRRELMALVASSKLESKLAREEADRQARLEAMEAAPRAARDQAVTAAQVADARLTAARARLAAATQGAVREDLRAAEYRIAAAVASRDRAMRERSRAILVAPASGIVLARRIDRGDGVERAAFTALFEIADPEHIELRAEVEERHASRVETGARVAVTDLGGVHLLGRGTVSRLGARVSGRAIAGDPSEVRADSLVRATYVEVDQDTPLALPIGQRLEVAIALRPEHVAARIPRRALVLRDGAPQVVLARGLFRETRPVELGFSDADFVEVRGLAASDRVVLR